MELKPTIDRFKKGWSENFYFDKGPWNSKRKIELPKLEILERVKEVPLIESTKRKLKIK